MTLEEFRRSATVSNEAPPPEMSAALAALWCDARGDWSRAHEFAQKDRSRDGSWVHAYLHRKEGDLGNAEYWYSRAAKKTATGSLEHEWSAIAVELLGSS